MHKKMGQLKFGLLKFLVYLENS